MTTIRALQFNLTLNKLITSLYTVNMGLFSTDEVTLLRKLTNNTEGDLKLSVETVLNAINRQAKDLIDSNEQYVNERQHTKVQVLFMYGTKLVTYDTVIRKGDGLLYTEYIRLALDDDKEKYSIELDANDVNNVMALVGSDSYSIYLVSTTIHTKEVKPTLNDLNKVTSIKKLIL